MDKPRRIEYAATSETERRKREVQLLINVAEPDPEYQPFFLSDEANLYDAVGTAPEDIQRRLDAYFGERLAVSLRLPVYQLVDAIRALRPEWPDDM
ncbi:MAG TPA: hypothetical protein VGD77_15065 [Gemmatimonadaceae bacterium]